jgi:hypothetical protein
MFFFDFDVLGEGGEGGGIGGRGVGEGGVGGDEGIGVGGALLGREGDQIGLQGFGRLGEFIGDGFDDLLGGRAELLGRAVAALALLLAVALLLLLCSRSAVAALTAVFLLLAAMLLTSPAALLLLLPALLLGATALAAVLGVALVLAWLMLWGRQGRGRLVLGWRGVKLRVEFVGGLLLGLFGGWRCAGCGRGEGAWGSEAGWAKLVARGAF